MIIAVFILCIIILLSFLYYCFGELDFLTILVSVLWALLITVIYEKYFPVLEEAMRKMLALI